MVEQDAHYDVRCAVTAANVQKITRGHVLYGRALAAGEHPPLLVTFGDVRARIDDEFSVHPQRLPTDLVIFLVSLAAVGIDGTQESRMRAALRLLTAPLDRCSREQLVQNLLCYRPDVGAIFTRAGAALRDGAKKSSGHVVLRESLCAGMPSYASTARFPHAEAEYVFSKSGGDLHLLRIILRRVRVAIPQEEIDALVDAAHLSPALQSVLLPQETDDEFVKSIKPFALLADADAPPADPDIEILPPQRLPVSTPHARRPPARPTGPTLTTLEKMQLYRSDIRDFAKTGFFTTTLLEYFITRKFAALSPAEAAKQADLFVCGTDVIQLLQTRIDMRENEANGLGAEATRARRSDRVASLREASTRRAQLPEEVVAECFQMDSPLASVWDYYTEAADGPDGVPPPRTARDAPRQSAIVRGRRSLLVDRDYIFFPVNHHNKHWCVYLFWRPFAQRTPDTDDAGLVFIFDSLVGAVSDASHINTARLLKLFLVHHERLYIPHEPPQAAYCRAAPYEEWFRQPPDSNACGFFVSEIIGLFLTSKPQRDDLIRRLRQRQNPFQGVLHFTAKEWERKDQELYDIMTEEEPLE